MARALQLTGILTLPVAIGLQLQSAITEGQMLMIAVGGAAVFYVGHWMQRGLTRGGDG